MVGGGDPPLRSEGHVQLRFGDINPDKDLRPHHTVLLCGPALHDTGSTAHATVRALQCEGVTTLAVARSRRTTDPTVYHARVDDARYHGRPRRKIQGPANSPSFRGGAPNRAGP